MYLYIAYGPIIIPLFSITRIILDLSAEKLCIWTGNSSFCIIFINVNALLQRLFLSWALTKANNVGSIFFAVAIDFVLTLVFMITVCGPLTFYTQRWPGKVLTSLFWIVGRENVDEILMTEEEKILAIRKRANKTYFFVLFSFGEIMLAFWQVIYYNLFKSEITKRAYMGFEREVNGFPIINLQALYKTVSIQCIFDVLNLIIFTYGIRKKFPEFSPFKFLNILVKKYNILLGMSVMAVGLTVLCMMIIDCRIDITFSVG